MYAFSTYYDDRNKKDNKEQKTKHDLVAIWGYHDDYGFKATCDLIINENNEKSEIITGKYKNGGKFQIDKGSIGVVAKQAECIRECQDKMQDCSENVQKYITEFSEFGADKLKKEIKNIEGINTFPSSEEVGKKILDAIKNLLKGSASAKKAIDAYLRGERGLIKMLIGKKQTITPEQIRQADKIKSDWDNFIDLLNLQQTIISKNQYAGKTGKGAVVKGTFFKYKVLLFWLNQKYQSLKETTDVFVK